MLVGKSSVFKNSPPTMLYTESLLICKTVFSVPAFFPNWCFFLSLCVSSHIFSSSAHLISTPSDTHKCSRIHSCTHTLLVLICILIWFFFLFFFFFCWACFVWHSFYILIQNMLNSVYLKLQLFKHSTWSLWEVGGVQGMPMKVADDDLYLAHLPLPTKSCLQD